MAIEMATQPEKTFVKIIDRGPRGATGDVTPEALAAKQAAEQAAIDAADDANAASSAANTATGAASTASDKALEAAESAATAGAAAQEKVDELEGKLADPEQGADKVARSSITVDSIDALRSLAPGDLAGSSAFVVTGYDVGARRGGGIFRWVPDAAEDNGYNIIVNSISGHFRRDDEDVIDIAAAGGMPGDNISSILNDLMAMMIADPTMPRTVQLGPFEYEIDESVRNFIARLQIVGQWGKTTLKYVGAEDSIALKVFHINGLSNALLGTGITGITLDLDFVAGATGISYGYATNSTLNGRIRVVNVGVGGVGIDITKQWYAFYGDLEVNNPNNTKGGVAIRIYGDEDQGALSQVNAITFPKMQIKGFEDGLLIDTEFASHYTLSFDVVIEQCVNAVRCTGRLGLFKAWFKFHFENNTNNVVWGTPDDLSVQTGVIDWDGYAGSGLFKFSHGHHTGRVKTLSGDASVFISNTARVAWYGPATDNTPGDYPDTTEPLLPFRTQVNAVGDKPSNQTYAPLVLDYGKVASLAYVKESGVDYTFDPTQFLRESLNRTKARIDILMVRDSDGTSRWWSGYVYRRNTTNWGNIKIGGSDETATFTITRDSAAGTFTHSGSLSGHVSVLVTPL